MINVRFIDSFLRAMKRSIMPSRAMIPIHQITAGRGKRTSTPYR